MNLIKFALRTCPWMVLTTAFAALLSGACNAGLIAAVNRAMNHPGTAAQGIFLAFVGLGLGKLFTGYLSQLMLTSFSQTVAARLRQDLVRKILAVPLRYLEVTGIPRVMVTLTDDVGNITQALLAIPIIGVNIAIVVGGAAYLAWLSWKILLLLCLFSIAGALGYVLFMRRGLNYLHLARDIEDKLFGHFRGLTEGIKELKLHRNRRGVFLDQHIQSTTEGFQRYNIAAENRFILAQTWSHLMFFGLLGMLLFYVPRMESFSKETLTGYIITTLYLMGPLVGVLSSFSLFSRAGIALGRVENLGLSLSEQPAENGALSDSSPQNSFERLELVEVTHSYHVEKDDSSFVLGPISLAIQRNEVAFIVGGNGSGKSTLAKLLTGLYPPESGHVRFNGQLVTDQNRDDFRQLFSAVFADFYLFESLLGLESSGLDSAAQDYLVQLHLQHKVTVKDGQLSTTALSQGQRKRLALLTAYLEDRPVYLFDEWASDQDPYFKEIFYTKILPDLKARGKTVLVITHDDKYYPLADRLIKLESGQVVLDTRQPGAQPGQPGTDMYERLNLAVAAEKAP